MPTFETEASRWIAVQSRDPSADGKFVYCVKTTGIYCRPVCKARIARRSNVTFHVSSDVAKADGFRPCLRCKPELERYDPQSKMISKACAIMQANASQGKGTTLGDLAAEVGLAQSHFHRVFKSVMGVTPKAHTAALLRKARATMERSSSRPGSLTPSLDHSSGSSSGMQTPYLAPAPFSLVEQQTSCALLNTESFLTTKVRQNCLQPRIEFTIQPWQSGYVLVAVANNELRAIDVGDNYAELMAVMERRFPTEDLVMSDWTRTASTNPLRSPSQLLFASLMDALENPTGRVLHLPSNVFEVYG